MKELNPNRFYVYCFFNCDWNEPFYIGKGTGNRYKNYFYRTEQVKAIFKNYNCESRIILNNLTEQQSYKIEKELKNILKSHGKPIIDGENIMKHNQRKGLDAMPVDKATGKKKSIKTGNVIGRPEITFPENWDIVYPEWKNGTITAVSAMQKMNLKKNSFYKLVKKFETTVEN